ncbi:MAG: hypothetical protein J5365_02005 [Erysipelotrichaceae bacterium]|nr:hypothetical protein [Erysipelotrichaceae bacterium]
MNKTEEIIEKIEKLLKKPCWVIDILPYQVPQESAGQYFAVEEHYLKDPQNTRLRQCFADLLLKLNCYYDFLVYHNDRIIEKPSPEQLEEMILHNTDTIDILLQEDVLITVQRDDTYLTVYDPDEKLLKTLKQLSAAHGLFLWKPE